MKGRKISHKGMHSSRFGAKNHCHVFEWRMDDAEMKNMVLRCLGHARFLDSRFSSSIKMPFLMKFANIKIYTSYISNLKGIPARRFISSFRSRHKNIITISKYVKSIDFLLKIPKNIIPWLSRSRQSIGTDKNSQQFNSQELSSPWFSHKSRHLVIDILI